MFYRTLRSEPAPFGSKTSFYDYRNVIPFREPEILDFFLNEVDGELVDEQSDETVHNPPT